MAEDEKQLKKAERFRFKEDLIREVEEHRCLWDKSHPDHFNAVAVLNAWKDVNENLQCDAAAPVWNKLKAHFISHRGAVLSGKKSKFRFADSMEFLTPKMSVESGSSRRGSRSALYENDDKGSPLFEEMRDTMSPLGSSPYPYASGTPPIRFNNQSQSDKPSTFQIFGELDEYDNFCLSLSPRLRRISQRNPVESAKVQLKIMEAFCKAEKRVDDDSN